MRSGLTPPLPPPRLTRSRWTSFRGALTGLLALLLLGGAGPTDAVRAESSLPCTASLVTEAPAEEVPLPEPAGEQAPVPVDLPTLIRTAAGSWGHGPAAQERLVRIAWCESTMGRYPRNFAGSGAGGVPFHFIPSTWRVASERAGLPGASRDDPAANVSVAAFWVLYAGWQEFACTG